jgi:hypothetical protein
VRFSIKVAALSVILVADLAFFLFFPTALTQYYNQIFQILPWADNLELTIIVIIGLIIAVITSILLVSTIVKKLMKSIQVGTENE